MPSNLTNRGPRYWRVHKHSQIMLLAMQDRNLEAEDLCDIHGAKSASEISAHDWPSMQQIVGAVNEWRPFRDVG